jgi:hypothetical protein
MSSEKYAVHHAEVSSCLVEEMMESVDEIFGH